jgi:DGQHR domain-containing protein
MSDKIIEIEAFQLNQFIDKEIIVTTIPFVVLRKLVKFTMRESQAMDPFSPDRPIDKVTEDASQSYYQRLTQGDRTLAISNFLLKELNKKITKERSALGAFPSSLILAFKKVEEIEDKNGFIKYVEEFDTIKDTEDEIGVFLDQNLVPGTKKLVNVLLPKRKLGLIVDGQHRMAGLNNLYEAALNNELKVGRKPLIDVYPQLTSRIVISEIEKFEFQCTILLGYDLWEQGKIFADVNFNQKPVNKSLYYDIFGSYPDNDKNEIFLAHMLTLHLNKSNKSVLQNKIKLLGKGEGMFSQAFFVEALMPLFRDGEIWEGIPYDYANDGDSHKFLPKFFRAYFSSLKKNFTRYWPTEDENTSHKYKKVMLKTTGAGALIKLIPHLYKDISKTLDIESVEESYLEKVFDDRFKQISDKGATYFSSDGEFGGAGSKGLQNKLYIKIATDMGYIKPANAI